MSSIKHLKDNAYQLIECERQFDQDMQQLEEVMTSMALGSRRRRELFDILMKNLDKQERFDLLPFEKDTLSLGNSGRIGGEIPKTNDPDHHLTFSPPVASSPSNTFNSSISQPHQDTSTPVPPHESCKIFICPYCGLQIKICLCINPGGGGIMPSVSSPYDSTGSSSGGRNDGKGNSTSLGGSSLEEHSNNVSLDSGRNDHGSSTHQSTLARDFSFTTWSTSGGPQFTFGSGRGGLLKTDQELDTKLPYQNHPQPTKLETSPIFKPPFPKINQISRNNTTKANGVDLRRRLLDALKRAENSSNQNSKKTLPLQNQKKLIPMTNTNIPMKNKENQSSLEISNPPPPADLGLEKIDMKRIISAENSFSLKSPPPKKHCTEDQSFENNKDGFEAVRSTAESEFKRLGQGIHNNDDDDDTSQGASSISEESEGQKSQDSIRTQPFSTASEKDRNNNTGNNDKLPEFSILKAIKNLNFY